MRGYCPFCAIVAGELSAERVHEWSDAVAIVPINPVVSGHVLVIPRVHVADASVDPLVTGMAAARAAELASSSSEHFNLITSAGEDATQTVPHLHWHLVPRRAGDGLALPWTGGVA